MANIGAGSAQEALSVAEAVQQALVAGAVEEVATTSPALTADLHATPLVWRRWLDA